MELGFLLIGLLFLIPGLFLQKPTEQEQRPKKGRELLFQALKILVFLLIVFSALNYLFALGLPFDFIQDPVLLYLTEFLVINAMGIAGGFLLAAEEEKRFKTGIAILLAAALFYPILVFAYSKNIALSLFFGFYSAVSVYSATRKKDFWPEIMRSVFLLIPCFVIAAAISSNTSSFIEISAIWAALYFSLKTIFEIYRMPQTKK